MPHLQILTHDGKNYNFPITQDKTTIGRTRDNDIVFPNPRVSSKHAEIIKKGKQLYPERPREPQRNADQRGICSIFSLKAQ